MEEHSPELTSFSYVAMQGTQGRILKTPFKRVLVVRQKSQINPEISTDSYAPSSTMIEQPEGLKLRYRPFGALEPPPSLKLKKKSRDKKKHSL
jgi:hypothetical protein